MSIDLDNKKTLILIIAIIIILIIGYSYYKIIYMHRNNNLFAIEAEKYYEENENPIFKLEKILIYSDANVEDLSENSNLSNINISQFTDFAIYIDNKAKIKELTEENTINNVYIDNIVITDVPLGEQKIYFKDVKDICKYEKIDAGVNKIDYKVIHKNSEKDETVDKNTFFTDCSEPLIMSYVNENIVQNVDVSSSNEKFSLDGSILKYLGVKLEKLNYKISFNINIENNLGEKFLCKCSINIDLTSKDGGMYTGYIMQIYDMTNFNYKFKKVN